MSARSANTAAHAHRETGAPATFAFSPLAAGGWQSRKELEKQGLRVLLAVKLHAHERTEARNGAQRKGEPGPMRRIHGHDLERRQNKRQRNDQEGEKEAF